MNTVKPGAGRSPEATTTPFTRKDALELDPLDPLDVLEVLLVALELVVCEPVVPAPLEAELRPEPLRVEVEATELELFELLDLEDAPELAVELEVLVPMEAPELPAVVPSEEPVETALE